MIRDERKTAKKKLKELAFIDDLTSLYNRRYLYQYLPAQLKDMQQSRRTLSLFMMDVDNFKKINDTYGHLCGDKVLLEIAQILQKSLRQQDTLIRYAGDEFLAILPETEEQTALNVAKEIIKKIDKNSFRESEDKPNFHLTLSIGLALFARDAEDPERLIYQADRALYASKRSGGNHICTTKDIPPEVLDEAKLLEIFPSPQLIGRKIQMDVLKQLLDEVKKGKSKFAIITGERGLGKTRLINEFKKQAQLEGVFNISTSGSPETSRQPYQILIAALGNLFTSLGPQAGEFIRSLPEAQTAQLANYIPSLKRFLSEEFKTPLASSPEQAQIDLFKGICQSLNFIVQRNALLFTIDDFQWVDKETLQLLNYIIKKLHDIPICIVAGSRTEELEKRSDKFSPKELLRQMEKDGLINKLDLKPLEKEEALEMIEAIFAGMQVSSKFLQVIYDVSAGNPLFAEQILRSLVNKEFIVYKNGKWQAKEISQTSLPPYLKEAIQRNFDGLDEETKPVVSAAAVIGETFDFDVLCQLLEKDAGFILEAIDRAAKQHLIIPESPLQSDKFKFNSGAIWDVIYNNLNAKQRQQLHSKLASIEEKAYKNDLNPVAGSLGYHFDKANDREKANFYSDMLLDKVERMPAYEDIVSFLQEAFLKEGEEEEKVASLSAENSKLIPKMLRSLRLATMNIRLYPSHSKVRKDFIEDSYKIVIKILAKDNTLVVNSVTGFLLINGEAISEKCAKEAGASVIISLMRSHRIRSIIFKKNLTKEQFIIFLEGLGQSNEELIAEGGLSGKLRKRNVTHIKVNKIRYEQITTRASKERAKFEEAMLVDYLIGKVSNLEKNTAEVATQIVNNPQRLARTMEEIAEKAVLEKGQDKAETQANIVAKSLQKLSAEVFSQNKGGIEQYHQNLTQAVLSLNKEATAAFRDIIKDTVQDLTDEEILQLITKEFSQSGGNLANMRIFLSRILSDPQRKQRLLPELKALFQRLGMDEEEIAWVLKEELWQDLSPEEKAKRIVELSPDDYIKLEVSTQINNLVVHFLENDQYSQASEIIDKLLKQLEDESKDVRNVTISDLGKISQTLIFKEKYFLLEQIINSLFGRLDKEKDPQTYSLIAQGLATICATLIKKQNFTQATGILREFNLRLGKSSQVLEIQQNAIKKVRDRTIVTPALLNWLTKLMAERIESHRDFYELSKVISELGTTTIDPLFALGVSGDPYADPFKAYAFRWCIAKIFKEMGDEAAFYLKDKLADKNNQVVKVALELFGHMQNKSALKYLRPLLKHKDLSLRKEVIATLGKIGGPEVIDLLSEFLKDKNSQIRLASIWALANVRSPEALHILKPLLKDKQTSEETKRIVQRIIERI